MDCRVVCIVARDEWGYFLTANLLKLNYEGDNYSVGYELMVVEGVLLETY